MCINEKHQCRYCDDEKHIRTEFCPRAEKTGKVCLAPSFQTLGPVFSKTPWVTAFNADTLSPKKYKAVSCESCHKIELEVLQTLPGNHSLYTYNSDGHNYNGQHLNDAVLDGTMQVVTFGWQAWTERLNRFASKYEAMSKPRSHSGLTDDEDELDTQQHETPPSPPYSPENGSANLLRRQMLKAQADLRRMLNENNARRLQSENRPPPKELGVSEAMVEWGKDYPILRLRAKTAPLSKIRQAMKRLDEEDALDGDISSTMETSIMRAADRHEEWSRFEAGLNSGAAHKAPPIPVKEHSQIDSRYRLRLGLPIVKF